MNPSAPAPAQGALFYVMGVNLIIWAGLFLYLLYLDRKVRAASATHMGEDRP
jgi:CcmD family protein